MRRRLAWTGLLTAAVVVGVLHFSATVSATPAMSFTGTTIAKGTFGDFDVFNHFNPPSTPGDQQGREQWISMQKAKGPSDLYVQNNTWQPGGTTGWHTHPGHSLIIVTEGELVVYESENGACTSHVYTAGMGLVDPGGDHAHVIRNESAVAAKTVAVQLIPAGATRRVDVIDVPAGCPQ